MLPSQFINRIKTILPPQEHKTFLDNCTQPLPKTIRLTPKLAQNPPKDWQLTPTLIPNTFFIQRKDQSSLPLGKTLEHFTGKAYIATLSSLLPPHLLLDEQTDYPLRVLDMCAAPGSKTTLLAQLMDNKGLLVANEPSASRAKKLVANLERMGTKNTVVLQKNGTKLNQLFEQQFDRILLDAPCSSEGYGRKDAGFYEKMWKESKIYTAAKLQKQLITTAFQLLAPEGEMLYSTCTTAPEENEAVVNYLLKNYPQAEVVPLFATNPQQHPSPLTNNQSPETLSSLNSLSISREGSEALSKQHQSPFRAGRVPKTENEARTEFPPHHQGLSHFQNETYHPTIAPNAIRLYPHLTNDQWDSECFFCCKIRKKEPLRKATLQCGSTAHTKKHHKIPFTPNFTPLTKNQTATHITHLHKTYGLPKEILTPYTWIEKHDGSLWITSKEAARFTQRHPIKRAGFPVFDRHGNLTSAFAIKFGPHATKNILEIDTPQKDRWLAGYDLPLDPPSQQHPSSSSADNHAKTLSLSNGLPSSREGGKALTSQSIKIPEPGEFPPQNHSKTILITHQGFCLGYGTIQNEGKKLKNKLDRDLCFQ